jgi:hypothetical protein
VSVASRSHTHPPTHWIWPKLTSFEQPSDAAARSTSEQEGNSRVQHNFIVNTKRLITGSQLNRDGITMCSKQQNSIVTTHFLDSWGNYSRKNQDHDMTDKEKTLISDQVAWLDRLRHDTVLCSHNNSNGSRPMGMTETTKWWCLWMTRRDDSPLPSSSEIGDRNMFWINSNIPSVKHRVTKSSVRTNSTGVGILTPVKTPWVHRYWYSPPWTAGHITSYGEGRERIPDHKGW